MILDVLAMEMAELPTRFACGVSFGFDFATHTFPASSCAALEYV